MIQAAHTGCTRLDILGQCQVCCQQDAGMQLQLWSQFFLQEIHKSSQFRRQLALSRIYGMDRSPDRPDLQHLVAVYRDRAV